MASTGTVLMVEQGGRGGLADYTLALSRALAGEGWKVGHATALDHVHPPVDGVRHLALFPYLRGRGPVSAGARRLKLNKLVSGGGYVVGVGRLTPVVRRADVVHVQGGELAPLDLLLVLWCRLLGTPVVITPHNTFERQGRWMATRHRVWRDAAALVVHTSADLSAVPARIRPRTAIIPHGEYGSLARTGAAADPRAARARLGLDENTIVALLFGQLRGDKGIADALGAVARVPGTHLVLAGEDAGGLAEVAELLRDPEIAAHTTVRKGFATMDEAAQLFAAADVVLLPYPRASQSGVLLLAYGFDRPVVAYPVGGLPEAVRPGQTGWLTAVPAAEALARTLGEVVAAGRDECARRGRAGRRLAEAEYAWPQIARRTIAVYRRSVTDQSRGRAETSTGT